MQEGDDQSKPNGNGVEQIGMEPSRQLDGVPAFERFVQFLLIEVI